MLHGVAVEIAELEVHLAGQGGAKVGRQPATGLQAGFEQNAERHFRLPPGLEVPGIGRHIVLRDTGHTLDQLERLTGDIDDAIKKLEGRPGQPSDLAFSVKHAVWLTEGFGRIAG